MKKIIIAAILLFAIGLTGCSDRELARFGDEISLPPLPGDMAYINDLPRIISISTESDGDVMLAYQNTLGQYKIQLYGCPAFSIPCKLTQQGSYVFRQ